MAGHSKWANIKHRKGRQDAKKGKIFTRIAKEITISAREGGGDPDANPRLRLAIQNGRSQNMPNENITRAIKKGTGEIEGVTYEEITYEGYAPSGVAVIIETVTDNRNRTVADLRNIMGKLGGNLGESGSVAWNFERKGVITINTDNKTEDELLEHVLEAGADDLEYGEESSRIVAAMENFSTANKYFDSVDGIEITEAKLEYIPKDMAKVTDLKTAEKVIKFIDNLEDYEDVQNLFSNMEIDDDIIEQLDQ